MLDDDDGVGDCTGNRAAPWVWKAMSAETANAGIDWYDELSLPEISDNPEFISFVLTGGWILLETFKLQAVCCGE